MSDLFICPIRPKWCAKSHKLPMNTILPPYQVLAKILLTNICHIGRHTKLIIEKAQFMYAITTDIPIDLASHFFDVIQTTTIEKEVSLSFGGLISGITIMKKVPLHDSELTIKMYRKTSVVTTVKFEVVVNKNDHILKSLPSISPKLLKPAPYSIL